nr:nucleotidyl transferase AbiEii/AbiGii toxin family protein [Phytoactinopolyspora mesophila]
MARLVDVAPGEWVLKGGFALDLRLEDRARSTKDIDLAWQTGADELLDTLIDVATHDLGDFFTFAVERTQEPPERFGGAYRFRAAANLAGRTFETFVLDVGDAREAVGVEVLTTPDLLGFAGIEPVAVPTIPIAVQVAEKLHAYTRVYEGGRVSSRAKDLVDLALIAQLFALDAGQSVRAIEDVFATRATHQPPRTVPAPPAQWRAPFGQLAQAVGLDHNIEAGHSVVAAMLDPVLNEQIRIGTWSPDAQQWVIAAS